MQIGFEAKRIFQNVTGLGNYARNLVDALSRFEPQNHYHLFAPKQTALFDSNQYSNVTVHTPQHFLHKQFKAYWRSKAMTHDIASQKMDIFHGLSAELPHGLEKLPLAKIVSVHDLIYERYPEQYKRADVIISRKKTIRACQVADGIAAMSVQTKQDLIDLYKIPADKITVTYQSCHEDFLIKKNADELLTVKSRYQLPEQFFLSVGSIIERKGLLKICQAMTLMRETIPLLVIGRGGGEYEKQVKNFIHSHGLSSRVLFLNEHAHAAHIDYKSGNDFPAIFQQAKALIYPSLFEGFGIPVLEAISSGIPVITGEFSSLPEAGGGGALYINPHDEHAIAHAMEQLLHDEKLCFQLAENGLLHAKNFTKEKIAAQTMALYRSFL
ncbi:MAG: glycosyltransferase family 4 protein [Chitinophagaceae bacterium]|nr:glycosyltransferase family 4 protein [Chitinophagaceae bacterium]